MPFLYFLFTSALKFMQLNFLEVQTLKRCKP